MSTSPLRQQFDNYMTLRGLSPKTKEAYIGAVKNLSAFYRKSPDLLDNQQIQDYLLYLIRERELSWSTCNIAFSAFRCFFTHVLKWNQTRFSIPPRPKTNILPINLSPADVRKLIDSVANLKHRAILKMVYGSGLRVSEVTRLKAGHIESHRMMVRVEQGKGRKDRYTILSKSALVELRNYWKAYRPQKWLFSGKDKNIPLSVSTAQRIYYYAKKEAGITEGFGIHTLRDIALQRI